MIRFTLLLTAIVVLLGCDLTGKPAEVSAEEKRLHAEMMKDLAEAGPEAIAYQRRYCGDRVGLAIGYADRCASWAEVLSSDGMLLLSYAESTLSNNGRADLAEKWFNHLRHHGASSYQKYNGLVFLRQHSLKRGDKEAYMAYLLESADLPTTTEVERTKIGFSKKIVGDLLYFGVFRNDPGFVSIEANRDLGLKYLQDAAALGDSDADVILKDLTSARKNE